MLIKQDKTDPWIAAGCAWGSRMQSTECCSSRTWFSHLKNTSGCSISKLIEGKLLGPWFILEPTKQIRLPLVSLTQSPVARNLICKVTKTYQIHLSMLPKTPVPIQTQSPFLHDLVALMWPTIYIISSLCSNSQRPPRALKGCRELASYACEYSISDHNSTF